MGSTMPGLAAVVEGEAVARRRLIVFRAGLYACLRRRADALFELADAVLTRTGPVGSLVELSGEKAFRRGHGALYDALACGDIDQEALGGLLARSWEVPDEGPLKIAVDVSPWPRPDAETSEGRCHAYASCRCDGARKTIPGWPYSFAAGLEWGATSWTALLDAVRTGPQDSASTVTAAQVGRVHRRLAAAGLLAGRPAAVFVFDSGYDLTRIAYLTSHDGVPVQVLGRVRSDRVFYGPAPQRAYHRQGGAPRRHGARFALAKPADLPVPDQQAEAGSARYGLVRVSAWHELHQQLSRGGGWSGHAGELPIVPGTVIRLQVDHLPGNRTPSDLWLWHHAPPGAPFDLDLLWKTYLRRFDLEHTFRLIKGALGWTTPQIRTPAQGERWTWLILAAHAQLRLARPLRQDLRRRWDKPIPPDRPLTPRRVHRGFPILRRHLATPASIPKPATAGPGRPRGTTRPPRPRHPVGKKHAAPTRKKSRNRGKPADESTATVK